MGFINLHVHDEYSQLDGFGTAKAYAERAKFLGQTALASTNHGNIDGLIKHQKACAIVGIKPILGCELYVVPDARAKLKDEKRGHMIVLVKNEAGWKGLCTLLSRANIEGFYYRPRVSFQWILDLPSEQIAGLVFMSACLQSFLRLPGGMDLALALSDCTDFFIEVMPWPDKEQVRWNIQCVDIAFNLGVPLVVTNDCHYVLPEDAEAQEVLLAIQRKCKWTDPGRFRFEHTGLHLRSEREMKRAFFKHGSLRPDVYERAMAMTEEIADLCNFTIPKMQINLPGERVDHDAAVIRLINDGIHNRYNDNMPKEHQDRLWYERKIISDKGFSPYFVVVTEFCQWCRDNGIMIGPGRGSVGGSIIAYLLGITDVNPMDHGLLFERFISPDRNDYPDIDLDIEASRRDEARAYLESKYGRDHVAGVSTFARMKGRAVIRDVARVFDVPYADVDEFAKTVSQDKGDELVKAAAETPVGKKFKAKYPLVVQMAQKLEGQVRTSGQHPAALIISKDSLVDGGRCNIVDKDGVRVVNWDMEDSEYTGLMKLDALRLETLTVIKAANKTLGIDLNKIKPDSSEVFNMLTQGKTAGVFQLSGYACKKLCLEMGVDNFDDIVAIAALSRPGPMNSGMTADYIAGKKRKGFKQTGCAPYDNIVKETYGVLVYQEQVMKVFTDVAGMSASLADKIRKVIGKKRDAAEFEPYRLQFIDGCKQQKTFSEADANKFWQGLLEWALYGFNKSHSVEYSIISYWTAYLKWNHPLEFLAAFLTYGEESQKPEVLADITERVALKLVTPKVKYSQPTEWIVKDGRVYMPFSAIKGVGEKDAHKCSQQRPPFMVGKGGFGNFFNLPKPVETKKSQASSLQLLLDEVKAFDDNVDSAPQDFNKYFGLDFAVRNVLPKRETTTLVPQRRRR